MPSLEMTSLESQLRASVAIIETRKAAERINALNENLNDRIIDLYAENQRLATQVQARDMIIDSNRQTIEILKARIRVLEERANRYRAAPFIENTDALPALLRPQA